jgi:hypothetical protein
MSTCWRCRHKRHDGGAARRLAVLSVPDQWDQGRAGEPPRPASVRLPDPNMIRELAWRTGLLGLGMYLVLTDDPPRNLRLRGA